MTEWLKVPLSKSGVRVTVPRVRIPLSPPKKIPRITGYFLWSMYYSIAGAAVLLPVTEFLCLITVEASVTAKSINRTPTRKALS